MSRRRHHADLGRLVDDHRPVNPLLGVALTAVIPVVIAIFPWLSLGPVAGICFLIGFGVPTLLAVAEWFFLRNQVYEHGIVLRSIPGLAVYVIPHYTIDPDAVAVGDRHHGSDSAVVVDRRLRISPVVKRTVWFTGLDARYARRLAKDKLDWDTAGDELQVRNGKQKWMPQAPTRWAVSARDAERFARLVADTVRRSHRVRPYRPIGGSSAGPA